MSRCTNPYNIKVYRSNIDDLIDALDNVEGLKEHVGMCTKDVLRTPVLIRNRNQRATILAINWKDIADIWTLIPNGTLLGKWLRHPNQGPDETAAFLDMQSANGNCFWDCVPPNSGKEAQAKLLTRGQSIIQEGTMIAANYNNATSMVYDFHGNRLHTGEYQVTRGKMGQIGKTTDIRCIEFLSPALPLVDRLLHAWPTKLQQLDQSVTRAFDGSPRLTYLNLLVTVGNRDKNKHVTYCLKRRSGHQRLEKYYHDQAGTVLHNDEYNTKGKPCVAIMFGAYEGFDYVYPTTGKTIKAPSGTILVADMHTLLHGVGGGTGIRCTLVFCQHASGLGKLELKNGSKLVINGAKTSRADVGENVARIHGLDQFQFI
jgi:hypothetical protein